MFILDVATSFEIKNQFIKSCVYFGVMIGAPLILLWNILIIKMVKWEIILIIIPLITLIMVFATGPLQIIQSSSAWKTQKIIYQNGQLQFKKVEFQMQNVGALGYNRRNVEVIYLTSLFMLVDTLNIKTDYDNSEWVKVNRDVNELGIKF
ncbi:hypothetical protein [Fulvivirga ligni]|uniref:hypothetical protein n=1 Tax=Fulvivirga ligni TaxID=2904246 RepID=UPI001F357A61|nr:hypothetical protein [Fulvivirga ligni]UII21702.1 hypothetical protein LVD16_00425 [Fulvivirga ligni]